MGFERKRYISVESFDYCDYIVDRAWYFKSYTGTFRDLSTHGRFKMDSPTVLYFALKRRIRHVAEKA